MEGNPFGDDDAEEEAGNPFGDSDEPVGAPPVAASGEDEGNPFGNDDDEEEGQWKFRISPMY